MSGLLDIESTDQNDNGKPKYHLEIKHINSNNVFQSEMFLKMQQSQLCLLLPEVATLQYLIIFD